MSYEVWGDGDDDGYYDHYHKHFIDNGWWDEDTSARVTEAVQALSAETVYEDGKKENGISERFLMRLSILRDECGLMKAPHEQAIVAEARLALNATL